MILTGKETCARVIFSATNPVLIALALNPGLYHYQNHGSIRQTKATGKIQNMIS
jgi:hypothetical protein